MKAIEILEWICKESISGENLNIVEVPQEGEHEWEQNEQWWLDMFGGVPPCPIESGHYLYYYESDINDQWIGTTDSSTTIELPTDYGFDYIYLYKIDDYDTKRIIK